MRLSEGESSEKEFTPAKSDLFFPLFYFAYHWAEEWARNSFWT